MLDGHLVPRKDSLRLGSMIQSDGGIDEDIRHNTQVGCAEWRLATGILCDRKFPPKLKWKFYKTTIRSVVLYGAECWDTKNQLIRELHATKICMLRWTCGHMRHDRIRNEYIRKKLGVAPIGVMFTQHRLCWFGHLQQRSLDAPVPTVLIKRVKGRIGCKGRPKLTWEKVVKWDLNRRNISSVIGIGRTHVESVDPH